MLVLKLTKRASKEAGREIGHVYMTTTRHTLMGHMKAMCTGWEEVPAKDVP